jgi:hypothetical protein
MLIYNSFGNKSVDNDNNEVAAAAVYATDDYSRSFFKQRSVIISLVAVS